MEKKDKPGIKRDLATQMLELAQNKARETGNNNIETRTPYFSMHFKFVRSENGEPKLSKVEAYDLNGRMLSYRDVEALPVDEKMSLQFLDQMLAGLPEEDLDSLAQDLTYQKELREQQDKNNN